MQGLLFIQEEYLNVWRFLIQDVWLDTNPNKTKLKKHPILFEQDTETHHYLEEATLVENRSESEDNQHMPIPMR